MEYSRCTSVLTHRVFTQLIEGAMMKAIKVWACVAVIAAGGMSTWQVSAQETPAKTAAKTDPRGPLPAQFGKLGVQINLRHFRD